MRFTFLVAIALSTISFSAHADEFGARFFNQAPPGLGDFTADEHQIPDVAMDDAAQDMQNIMPAAGEEGEAERVQNEAEEQESPQSE